MKEEFIEYVNEVIRNVPNNDDNLLGKLTKIFGIALSTQKFYEANKLNNNRKKFNSINDPLFAFFLNDYFLANKPNKFVLKSNNSWNRVFVKDGNIGDFIFWSSGYKKDNNISLDELLLISKKFNYEKLGSYISEKYGNKLLIEKDKSYYDASIRTSEINFNLTSLSLEDKIFEFESNKKALKDLSKKGTYLFFGDPGSGKSSFVFSESMKDKKIVILPANLFCSLNGPQVKRLLNVINPEILLIEEFDKVALQLDEILIKLERLNDGKFTTVLTANSLKQFNKAVIRPKRIDKIIHFKNPNHEEIKELINYFSNYKEHNEKLFDLIKDKNLSNAYIVDLAKKLSEDFDDVKDYIDFLDKYLEKDKEEK